MNCIANSVMKDAVGKASLPITVHTANCDYSTTAKMKKCPLAPLGCSAKATMEKNKLNQHLQESQYNHLAMLVNCMQLLINKVSRMQSVTPMHSMVTHVEANGGYETMPGYERTPISFLTLLKLRSKFDQRMQNLKIVTFDSP